jgi:glycosyltransferase involved in cell wall biosynthesis
MPDLSIVTPSFNQGEFLRDTIKSVLSQQSVDVEYVLMDGGSTDLSEGIINEYKSKFHYWQIKKDNGQTNAINMGFEKTSSNIMGYINSDDYYVENAFQIVKEFFKDNPQVDFLIGRCNIVDHINNFLYTYKYKPISKYEYLSPKEGIRNFIPQPATFWRRDVWNKVGPFSQKYINAFDYHYFLKILLNNHKVGYLDDILASYRVHDNQKSNNITTIYKETVMISLDYCNKFNVDKCAQKKINKDIQWCNYKAGLVRIIGSHKITGYKKYLFILIKYGFNNSEFALWDKVYYWIFLRPLIYG